MPAPIFGRRVPYSNIEDVRHISYLAKPPCEAGIIEGNARRMRVAPGGSAALAATILRSSMVFIDGSVVNVALPAIQDDLNSTAAQTQWVMESYALFLAALILVGGSFGDHFGRRRIFVVGTALFALTSIWCGIAPSVGMCRSQSGRPRVSPGRC